MTQVTHLDKIIGKNSHYYIASYSVHASILENLVRKNAKRITLLVDGGGLIAHAGTFSNADIFKDYTSITHKTLHAKVIYVAGPKLLCLMTGNLRKTAISNEENIVIIQSLTSRQGAEVIRWFKKEKLSDHLFIQLMGNAVRNIYTNSNSVWKEFSTLVEGIKGSHLSVYAFSPWGSSRFVREIENLMKDRMVKLSLYTRETNPEEHEEKTSMWIDYSISRKSVQIERYTRKEDLSLPHFKAIFITEKNGNSKEKLVLAYIGSANLTEAAFFKKDNIEHAAFFTDIKKNSYVDLIFKELGKRRNWEERPPSRNVSRGLDDHYDGICIETWDNTDNFEIRRLAKKIITRFKSIKMQRKLESCYRQSRKLRLNDLKCSIQVESITRAMFDLNVYNTKQSFPLSIPRNSFEEILSDHDIQASLEKLMNTSTYSSPVVLNTKRGKREEYAEPTNSLKFKNIRFPLEKFIRDKSLIAAKKDIVKKLDKSSDRLESEDKEIYEMWSQIIKQL